MGERTTVIGTILAVVFQNEENGLRSRASSRTTASR